MASCQPTSVQPQLTACVIGSNDVASLLRNELAQHGFTPVAPPFSQDGDVQSLSPTSGAGVGTGGNPSETSVHVMIKADMLDHSERALDTGGAGAIAAQLRADRDRFGRDCFKVALLPLPTATEGVQGQQLAHTQGMHASSSDTECSNRPGHHALLEAFQVLKQARFNLVATSGHIVTPECGFLPCRPSTTQPGAFAADLVACIIARQRVTWFATERTPQPPTQPGDSRGLMSLAVQARLFTGARDPTSGNVSALTRRTVGGLGSGEGFRGSHAKDTTGAVQVPAVGISGASDKTNSSTHAAPQHMSAGASEPAGAAARDARASAAEDSGGSVSFWITPRQVDKRTLTDKDLVLVTRTFEAQASGSSKTSGSAQSPAQRASMALACAVPAHLPPDVKSSIDSGMQSILYTQLPWLSAMLHFHYSPGVLVAADVRTRFPYPCGVAEEAHEVLAALAESPCAAWAGLSPTAPVTAHAPGGADLGQQHASQSLAECAELELGSSGLGTTSHIGCVGTGPGSHSSHSGGSGPSAPGSIMVELVHHGYLLLLDAAAVPRLSEDMQAARSLFLHDNGAGAGAGFVQEDGGGSAIGGASAAGVAYMARDGCVYPVFVGGRVVGGSTLGEDGCRITRLVPGCEALATKFTAGPAAAPGTAVASAMATSADAGTACGAGSAAARNTAARRRRGVDSALGDLVGLGTTATGTTGVFFPWENVGCVCRWCMHP